MSIDALIKDQVHIEFRRILSDGRVLVRFGFKTDLNPDGNLGYFRIAILPLYL